MSEDHAMPREQPEALHRALADLRRAIDGRPPATAPLQRPRQSRGMVIDPSASDEIARRTPED